MDKKSRHVKCDICTKEIEDINQAVKAIKPGENGIEYVFICKVCAPKGVPIKASINNDNKGKINFEHRCPGCDAIHNRKELFCVNCRKGHDTASWLHSNEPGTSDLTVKSPKIIDINERRRKRDV